MRRMMRKAWPGLLLTALCALLGGSVPAQTGGGHTVIGDFKVDDSRTNGPRPQTFHVILYSRGGSVVARVPVTTNGRFRFNDVSNGEYNIVVEMENQEVARIPIILSSPQKTDFRHDIMLEWKDEYGKKALPAGSVSAADIYRRSPENQKLYDMAQDALRKKELNQALSLFEQLVGRDEQDFEAWTELGTAHFRKEQTQEAERAYKRALEKRPGFFIALLNLGKVLLLQKQYEPAIETLEMAVKARPTSADANHFLGESYLQIKKGSKAVGYLYEAIRLDPQGKADVHLRIAALYHGAGLKQKAAVEYEQFLVKRPDYPEKKKLQQYVADNKR
jgi:tetratricopeptide (TPR) repeat protein